MFTFPNAHIAVIFPLLLISCESVWNISHCTTIRGGKWEEKLSIGYLKSSTAELWNHLHLISKLNVFTPTIGPYNYWQWSVLCKVLSGLLQNPCFSHWSFLGSPPTKWVWANLLLLVLSWAQVQTASRSIPASCVLQCIHRGKLTEVKTNIQTSVFLLKQKLCGKRWGFLYLGQRKYPVTPETQGSRIYTPKCNATKVFVEVLELPSALIAF